MTGSASRMGPVSHADGFTLYCSPCGCLSFRSRGDIARHSSGNQLGKGGGGGGGLRANISKQCTIPEATATRKPCWEKQRPHKEIHL